VLTVEELTALEYKQVMQERETTEPDPDMWRWSPLEMPIFIPMLNVAVSLAVDSNIRLRGAGGGLRRLSLAEAGSGIGTKLYLAKHFCDLEETGYEINDEYLERSAELGVNAVKWDLRTEHPPWVVYDIVYMARPFKDDDYEVQWEKEVMQRMRRGAVLISAYAAVKPSDWECFYRASFRGVWRKPFSDPPNYTSLIQRHTSESDPLVPEPLGSR
jgi:hypothetical protein